MKALLLIGGQATRLQPLSKYLPKALLPICDRELLHYQVSQLARAGVHQIGLAAGCMVDQLAEYVRGYSGGLEFHLSLEPEPRGTAGAIALARDWLAGDPAIVLNADILADVDLAKVIARHREQGRPATLVGYSVADPSRYGLLKIEGDRLAGFSEKPQGVLPEGPHYINAGIYVLEPEAVAEIPLDRAVSIEREVFPGLIDRHGALGFYAHAGFWIDVGTFESYFAANFNLLAHYYALGDNALWSGRTDCSVFKDLVYIGHGAELEPQVDLFHRVIVMAQARIGAGCRLQDCLVLPTAVIGQRCRLTSCIIGPKALVPDDAVISNQVLIEGEEPLPFYHRSM